MRWRGMTWTESRMRERSCSSKFQLATVGTVWLYLVATAPVPLTHSDPCIAMETKNRVNSCANEKETISKYNHSLFNEEWIFTTNKYCPNCNYMKKSHIKGVKQQVKQDISTRSSTHTLSTAFRLQTLVQNRLTFMVNNRSCTQPTSKKE